MKNHIIASCALATLLGGCASMTPTKETSVGYAIYDIKASGDVGNAKLAEAIRTALQRNTSRLQVSNGIPPSPLPEKAPRFQLVSPFKGSNLGALAAAQGQSLQVPTCEGATLTANARDSSMSNYGEATTFFACLMPYQGGYSLNIYTTFTKVSGSVSAATLGATLMRPFVGDSGQFIPRTIGQIVDGIQKTGVVVTLVEAYPS
ncbi:hypothetical protein HZ992_12345 [Rhizobacter sp. AJA081-3]|uniref:hypothetical protein n=1 Tax=Rhizobacter sp. AJA081-3 TaxID=2753607 RepID=UPI001ADF1887|nr:hypothetical protein [Rhizobacter sp. AJA081-3]QTN25689.1 hypothetical protein HZ992_12345 [Rhizobacter sp. AJA081-3]